MIAPTEADIGRRVVYEWRENPTKLRREPGALIDIESPRCVWVLFDEADGPIRVISNLKWADQ